MVLRVVRRSRGAQHRCPDSSVSTALIAPCAADINNNQNLYLPYGCRDGRGYPSIRRRPESSWRIGAFTEAALEICLEIGLALLLRLRSLLGPAPKKTNSLGLTGDCLPRLSSVVERPRERKSTNIGGEFSNLEDLEVLES
ncbi:hypothetical protein Tco_0682977 [Tanacetum coccineum]|uniref:Uncharacterized protein n=1 Tax=Tanacetum coccineum TaxID=301880 RepID=A0ABQ4XUF1_9ASTR